VAYSVKASDAWPFILQCAD